MRIDARIKELERKIKLDEETEYKMVLPIDWEKDGTSIFPDSDSKYIIEMKV